MIKVEILKQGDVKWWQKKWLCIAECYFPADAIAVVANEMNRRRGGVFTCRIRGTNADERMRISGLAGVLAEEIRKREQEKENEFAKKHGLD